VIPQLFGVAEPAALLVIATDLPDEAVNVDQQPLGPWARADFPRAGKGFTEYLVELADMPESERPQERSQRGGRRHPATQKPARAARTQYLAVIDAVRAQRHRIDQRHHLPARVRPTRPTRPQAHTTPDQTLKAQPLGECRDQRDPSVRDDPIVVKPHQHAVQSDRPVIVHHQGDLLTPGPGCGYSLQKPCSGGHLRDTTGQNPPINAVAVGTGVAARPPRRSQRAGLPHWAPALGDGGESLLGPGMQDSR